jgi:hypothetical protein
VLLLRKAYRRRKFRDGLADLQKAEQAIKQDLENKKDQMLLAKRQVDLLFDEVDAVGSTIHGAIVSVGNMEKTFQELSTCFKGISTRLGLVKSNSDVELVHSSVINADLNMAIATWDQVYGYAKVFTEKGLVRDAAKDPNHPDEPEDDEESEEDEKDEKGNEQGGGQTAT